MTVTFNLAAVCSRLQQACCANAHVHLSDNTHIHTHMLKGAVFMHALYVNRKETSSRNGRMRRRRRRLQNRECVGLLSPATTTTNVILHYITQTWLLRWTLEPRNTHSCTEAVPRRLQTPAFLHLFLWLAKTRL